MVDRDTSRGVIVITGASTGIGQATALRLDRRGFAVFAGVRKGADGERLRAEASDRLRPLRIDVTDAATIDEAKQAVASAVGDRGIAGLVNNAGVAMAGPVELVPVDEWRRQFEVNLFGHIAVTQAFLPMLRAGRGRIVNTGSIGGRFATPFLAPYSASKFALEALTDALRVELRPWGIHVSIIEPGSIATPIWEKGRETGDRLERELGAEGNRLYGDAVAALRAAVDQLEGRGIPPDRVAKAIEHALTARRPKTRYLVGIDAQMQAAAASVLPDRLVDRLITMQLGIGKQKKAREAEPVTR
jgi:NAD(P)-dependent dehydrogenase (short-subunit alcohol dehydrogenase family)